MLVGPGIRNVPLGYVYAVSLCTPAMCYVYTM
jgi:hypothetical protein